MDDLSKLENVIWEIIDKEHIGRTNAISQEELSRAIFFYPGTDILEVPKSLRHLRRIMRELKTKRPILESLRDKPGYHKPANWDEVRACLGRRKYSLIRQYNLNQKMLFICKEFIPHDEREQLKLFSKKTISDFPELSYKE